MLTNDDIKQILELYDRGYSYRKICGKTGFSENTIRKYINDFVEKVIALRKEGLVAEQIASHLECALACVYRALKEYKETQRQEIEDESAAEVKPEVEASEPSQRRDIDNDWQEFKRQQELSVAKELALEKTDRLTSELKKFDREVQSSGVADKDWYRQKKLVEDSIKVFITQQIGEIDCMEELSVLESIIIDIENRLRSLSEAYQPMIEDAVEASRREKRIKLQEEKEKSERLIDQRTKNVPLFPEFVTAQIKRLIKVKNDEQADIVFHAMAHYSTPLFQITQKDSKFIKEFWKIFVEAVQQRRWDYLIEMEKDYWKAMEETLLPIGVCPYCGNKLNTEHRDDQGVLRCIPCEKYYRLT